MGMFDDLKVHSRWLPEEIKSHEVGWQTKDLECTLSQYELREDGTLFVQEYYHIGAPKGPQQVFYTGSIRFYNKIGDIWYEMLIWMVNGQAKDLVQIEPQYKEHE